MVNKNISKTKEEEIYLLLVSLDRFFGKNNDRQTAMFNLYGLYDNQHDVLFPVSFYIKIISSRPIHLFIKFQICCPFFFRYLLS